MASFWAKFYRAKSGKMLRPKLKLLSSRCLSTPILPSASTSSFYDLCIVGGGLVGNAMACSIGQSHA
uniref:FAD dependent oxidoreductase domain-containing protein n=1 Tax=Ditylenchus dipsaci TaxID=166011 RepID=A0A915E7G9_9BILA